VCTVNSLWVCRTHFDRVVGGSVFDRAMNDMMKKTIRLSLPRRLKGVCVSKVNRLVGGFGQTKND